MKEALLLRLFRFWAILRFYRITHLLKHVAMFIMDLAIVLAVATLVMRFFIIVGLSQNASLIFGMASAITTNMYTRFRHKL